TQDGPEIIEGPRNWPKRVKVRRGSDIHIVDAANTVSLGPGQHETDPTPIGRFSAEFRSCRDLLGRLRGTGSWRLTASDGSALDAGTFEDIDIFGFNYVPFFRSIPGASDLHFAEFGERRLITADKPIVTTTQTFAAEPDKE